MSPARPRIVIDTREQTPLVPVIFKAGPPSACPWIEVPTVRAKLDAGDYSVEGLESVIAIERKSIADLAGTLYGSTTNALGERAGNLERFRAELTRLGSYERKMILVEGTPGEFDMCIFNRFRSIQPVNAHAFLASIAIDYNVPIMWAESRQRAEHFLGVTLSRVIDQMVDDKAAKKARERGLALPWLKA